MKLIPIFTAENNELFAKMDTHLVVIDGATVETAPLAFDRTIDLLSLSSNKQLIDNGITDHTDHLGFSAKIPSFHFRISNKNIPILPEDGVLYTSNVSFRPPVFVLDDDRRHLVINSHVEVSVVNTTKPNSFGKLEVQFVGLIALEFGTINLSATPTLTMDDTDGWVCEMLGYDLEIDRVNSNR